MQTRGRKILRDVWSRKARTLLVSISIFIGVFGTVTLFTMSDLVVRQLEEDLDEDALAMIRSYLGIPPGVTPDNDATLAALRDLPGVSRVEGQAVYPAYWKLPDDEDFHTSFVFGYSEPYDQLQLEPPSLVEGRFPEDGAQELVVERRLADKFGLEIDDQIVVRALSQVQNGAGNGDVPTETWTVVGTVFHPYSYATFTTVLPEDSLYATFADAQYLAAFPGYSSVYARYDDYALADSFSDEFEGTIAETGSYIPGFTFKEDPAENALISSANTFGGVMVLLALIALVVSGFLVFNVLNAIVSEQKPQIGVMKSLGATGFDNFIMYSGMALIYGVIGVILGVALGVPSGFFAAQGMAASYNSMIDEFTYSTQAIVMGVIVGLAVPVAASLLPVLNAMRVTIIEAITDLGISSAYGAGPLARMIARLPVPITIRQGMSNVLRKKGRILLTVITLTLAAGAFMGIYAVFASVNEVLNQMFNTYNSHFSVEPTHADDLPIVREVMAQEFDDMQDMGPYMSLAIAIDGFDKEFDPATGPPALFANGYEPMTDAYRVQIGEGESLKGNPDGVILARPTAEYMDKGVGDVITIHAGGRSDEFTIVGIASFPYDGAWFTWDNLARLSGSVTAEGEPVPGGILYKMPADDPTAGEVDDLTERINEALLERGVTAGYTNIELFIETLSDMIVTFQVLFNFTALLIALVGAVGLLSTLSMSVYERQKEIGVMRSIGAGSTSIVAQFLTEGIVVGLLAWLIGLPLSLLINDGLIMALDMGEEYNLGYPLEAAVLGLIGMLIITTIASIWPSISAARKTVSDILRYQ
ncbi:MAG: ABC transporter permease [Anaerolineae bacterium]|nr:ABC transporter permease [Anaerolineae bacterium]